MATAAQIAANSRNALRSTGPRTAAGKAVSSRNALRHGLTARSAVVLDEDPQDFGRFRAELRTALAPQDGREELLAETVVHAAWRLRRAARADPASATLAAAGIRHRSEGRRIPAVFTGYSSVHVRRLSP